MPVIRFYGAQTQAGAQSQANIDPEAFGAGIGRAAQQVGQQIAGVAEGYLARADKARRRKEAFDADIVIRQMAADDQTYLNQVKQEGRWDGAPDRAIEDSNKRNEAYRRNIQKRFSPEMQESILAMRNLQVQGFVQQAIGFEAAGRQEYEVNSINETLNVETNRVMSDARLLPESRSAIENLVRNSSLPKNKQDEVFAESIGKLTASSLKGRIAQGDWSAVLGEVKAGTYDDTLPPEVKLSVMSQGYAEQQRADAEALSIAQAQARQRLEDAVAVLERGGQVDQGQIDADSALAFGNDPRKFAQFAATVDTFELIAQAPTHSPQEFNAVIAELDKRAAASENNSDRLFALEEKEAYIKKWQENRKQFEQDPAAYVYSYYLQNKDFSTGRLVAESIKIQERLGLRAGEIRPLPKEAAASFADAFRPENAATAVETLEQLEATFGKNFPQVWNQIVTENKQIPRHFQYLDLLPDTVRQGILQNPTADKAATAGLKTESISTEIRVNTTFISLQRSFNHHFDGGQSFMNGFMPLLRQAVTQQMLKQGKTEADASMVESVMQKISDDYAFGENHDDSTYLIPRGFDPKDVERNLDDYLENLKQEDVQTDIKLAREGLWVSNDAKDGLELIDSLGNPVRDANGRIVEFSFEHIVKLNRIRQVKGESTNRPLQNRQARDAAAAAAAAQTAQSPVTFESLGD